MTKILVVVDMQNDFISGPLGSEEAVQVRNKIAKKLTNLDPNTYVIFTQDTHMEDYLETQEGKNLPIPHCIYGTDGWKLDENLVKPFNGSPFVIQKGTFGTFQLMSTINDYMAPDISEEDIEVTFCGVCTDICVISNALILKAAFPEAKISVAANMCAGTTLEAHEAAIAAMKSCQITII